MYNKFLVFKTNDNITHWKLCITTVIEMLIKSSQNIKILKLYKNNAKLKLKSKNAQKPNVECD